MGSNAYCTFDEHQWPQKAPPIVGKERSRQKKGPPKYLVDCRQNAPKWVFLPLPKTCSDEATVEASTIERTTYEGEEVEVHQ